MTSQPMRGQHHRSRGLELRDPHPARGLVVLVGAEIPVELHLAAPVLVGVDLLGRRAGGRHHRAVCGPSMIGAGVTRGGRYFTASGTSAAATWYVASPPPAVRRARGRAPR